MNDTDNIAYFQSLSPPVQLLRRVVGVQLCKHRAHEDAVRRLPVDHQIDFVAVVFARTPPNDCGLSNVKL